MSILKDIDNIDCCSDYKNKTIEKILFNPHTKEVVINGVSWGVGVYDEEKNVVKVKHPENQDITASIHIPPLQKLK